MLGSVIMEVVIGLVFVYAFLSVLCSGVTELISSLLSRRAAHLEAALVNLLDGPADSGKPIGELQGSVAHALVSHALIDPLSPAGKKVPGYIPAHTFATALIDVVLKSSKDVSTALRTAPSFDAVKTAVEGLGDARLKESLLALMAKSESKLETFRTNVERWFDDAMARMSGVYKRWTMAITVAVAVVVCGAMNADTFALVDHLSQSPESRKVLVQQAQQAIDGSKPIAASPKPALAAEEGKPAADDGSAAAAMGKQDLETGSRALLTAMDAGLPLGWGHDPLRGEPLARKIFGIILTALGVSLGAPFWFDLLGKLVNLRINGERPKPSAAKA
jgi:hypothetical protein